MHTHRTAGLIAALAVVFLVAASATPAWAQQGTLRVKVKPKTAYTLVDGRPFGQGNRSIPLSPGEHEVSIHRYGHKPYTERVNITADENTELDVTLEAVGGPVSSPWGRIRLMVNPDDTAVFLNGTSPEFLVGCTGATDTNFIAKQELLVRPGTHTLTLALDGYRTYTTTVDVAANERVEIRHRMQPGTGEETLPATAQTKKSEDRLANLNNIQREKTGFASMRAAVAAVTGQFAANPTELQCGQSARLTWSSEEAGQVEISGVGEVSASGEQLVEPTETTTYEFRAAGPGGVKTETATVTVNSDVTASLELAPEEIRFRKIGDKVVEHGTATLTWSTQNAETVAIEPLGSVSASGNRSVQPEPQQTAEGPVEESLTYTLNATNACGGSDTRTASLRIVGSIEPLPEVVLHSVFFPTDYPDERSPNLGLLGSQRQALSQLADGFKTYLDYEPNARLLLEAHADERRSVPYNRSLSERRAVIVKQFLVDAGIPSAQIDHQAFGEEQNLDRSTVRQLEEENPSKATRQRFGARYANWLAHNRRVDVVLQPAGQRSERYYPHQAQDSRILWQVPKPPRSVVEQNQ